MAVLISQDSGKIASTGGTISLNVEVGEPDFDHDRLIIITIAGETKLTSLPSVQVRFANSESKDVQIELMEEIHNSVGSGAYSQMWSISGDGLSDVFGRQVSVEVDLPDSLGVNDWQVGALSYENGISGGFATFVHDTSTTGGNLRNFNIGHVPEQAHVVMMFQGTSTPGIKEAFFKDDTASLRPQRQIATVADANNKFQFMEVWDKSRSVGEANEALWFSSDTGQNAVLTIVAIFHPSLKQSYWIGSQSVNNIVSLGIGKMQSYAPLFFLNHRYIWLWPIGFGAGGVKGVQKVTYTFANGNPPSLFGSYGPDEHFYEGDEDVNGILGPGEPGPGIRLINGPATSIGVGPESAVSQPDYYCYFDASGSTIGNYGGLLFGLPFDTTNSSEFTISYDYMKRGAASAQKKWWYSTDFGQTWMLFYESTSPYILKDDPSVWSSVTLKCKELGVPVFPMVMFKITMSLADLDVEPNASLDWSGQAFDNIVFDGN
ncbi:hypothetical protein [Kiloniella majae]|uniref:hypothetical protein n=1 Tax=Kiloniella majae TaxID=1938558 RepID=UPI000A27840A|nr:hypothetical protein [Kiloniella majae]